MNYKLFSTLLVATIFIYATKAQTPCTSDSLELELNQFINKEIKSKKAVGLSIAIIDNQNTIFSKGYGFADKENGIAASDSTVYRVGSVSKLFTAMGIMKLVQDGKIELDAPVRKYITEFNIKTRHGNIDNITIRSLLTHHSGLPSDIFQDMFCPTQKPFTGIVEHLNNEYVCQPPYYNFSYSNPGFTLLGVVIERVSQKSFYQFMKEEFFVPLNMKYSGFQLNDTIKKLYSVGYKNTSPYEEPYLRDVPAGMLHTNAKDLANMVKMVFNDGSYGGKQIIQKQSLDEMLKPQLKDITLDGSFNIGLSWFVEAKNVKLPCAGKTAGHGGDTYIYHADLTTYPEHKIGVIVITNTSNAGGLVRKVSQKAGELALKHCKGIRCKPDEQNTKSIKMLNPKKDELQEYEGIYAISGSFFKFKAHRNYLSSRMSGIKICFLPNNKGYFNPQARLLGGIVRKKLKDQGMKFHKIYGNYYLFAFKDSDSIAIGNRYQPNTIPEQWKQRVGSYESTTKTEGIYFFDKMELVMKDGMLLLKSKLFDNEKIEMHLDPISDSEAIVPGIGRQTGYTVTFKDGKLHLAGLIFKKKEE